MTNVTYESFIFTPIQSKDRATAISSDTFITHASHVNNFVVTMVNGRAKCMPDEESYELITFESMNSLYAKGSAEIVSSRILGILRQLR